MRDWFRRKPPRPPASQPPQETPKETPPERRPVEQRMEAVQYLERVRAKMSRLAEEFAAGSINRAQFQELFQHYQNERRTIETWLEQARDSESWKKAATEGKSVIIRRQHQAAVLGYAVYENDSGIPLNTIGEFEIDSALAIPMLSSYRSATQEIFGASMRSTEIEGGRWACFVSGQYTTLMSLFNTEPAAKQLDALEELHALFEQANRPYLQTPPADPERLVFPHSLFLGRP
jgi:hypothetical protein